MVPRERMMILVMERMLADEAATRDTLRQIFAFLGVDPEAEVALPAPTNTSHMPRSLFLAQQVRRLERSLVLRRALALPLLRDLPLRKLAWGIKGRNMKRPGAEDKALTPQQAHRLAAIFAPDIARLETLLGAPIPEWTAAAGAAQPVPPELPARRAQ